MPVLALSMHECLPMCVCVNISMSVGVCFHVFFSMYMFIIVMSS